MKAAAATGQPNKKFVWAKRLLTIFFFIAVPALLFTLMKNVDWQEVKDALQNFKPTTLALGIGLSLLSYGVFSSYDLIGRRYAGHNLPTTQVLPVAFVCYAFTLNLSAWVGGIALRYRLYSRLGLDTPTITKILSLGLITNWLGYILLAGSVFSLRLLNLPDNWKIGETGLQLIGFVLLAVALGYLFACRFAKRRAWRLFGYEITLPPLSMACTQALLATTNWMLMALIIFLLLPDKVSYPAVLGILLISSIAGVITHIPAGLGVLETIFITVLQHQLSTGTIVAALIGYRVMYFLVPLALACLVYFVLESRAKKLRQDNESGEAAELSSS